MGISTDIQWADSTLNLQAGCDGCELWNPRQGVRICYAGQLTERYGGRKGWPASFDKPALFPERLDQALRWPDLMGTKRPDKPWLDGLPRIIFLDDMGDTFTESLPQDWLAPMLPRIAASPHQFLLLTKRGQRMWDFFDRHDVPQNVWAGVSVTGPETLRRVALLRRVRGPRIRFVSIEPFRQELDLGVDEEATTEPLGILSCPDCGGWGSGPTGSIGLDGPIEAVCAACSGTRSAIDLLILGGASGAGAWPCNVRWIRKLLRQGKQAGICRFVKQLGANVRDRNDAGFDAAWHDGRGWSADGLTQVEDDPDRCGDRGYQGAEVRVRLRDSKGGDWSEWPEDLRVREMPEPIAARERQRLDALAAGGQQDLFPEVTRD